MSSSTTADDWRLFFFFMCHVYMSNMKSLMSNMKSLMTINNRLRYFAVMCLALLLLQAVDVSHFCDYSRGRHEYW